MQGSIWFTGACARLMDLIVARSDGASGPLSLPSLRRTSFSSAASSPKSTVVGCALQSAVVFFTNATVGAALGVGATDGVGTGAADGIATADALAAGAVSGFGSSQ